MPHFERALFLSIALTFPMQALAQSGDTGTDRDRLRTQSLAGYKCVTVKLGQPAWLFFFRNGGGAVEGAGTETSFSWSIAQDEVCMEHQSGARACAPLPEKIGSNDQKVVQDAAALACERLRVPISGSANFQN
ncbi:MAG: hypothetical protein AAF160_21700 [Pseudomonadota bacterium]